MPCLRCGTNKYDDGVFDTYYCVECDIILNIKPLIHMNSVQLSKY